MRVKLLGVALVLVLLTLSFQSAVQGNTYYVATDGEDAVPGGTSDHPWRTLQFAVDHVGPGDTILVRAGTYVGCRIQNSGTAAAWITLKAAPGAHVLVNAPGPDNRHGSNVEVETWDGDGTVSYWVIEGLEIANAPSWGIDLRGNATHLSHHLTVRGNAVHHNGLSTGRTGIFMAFVDHVLVENNESYANGEHGIYHSNSGDYPTIRGNVLHHNARCGIHMNGDASMGGDGVISHGLVERNVVYENGTGGGSGINMDGVTHTVVRNNLLYDNHASGISLYQIDGGSGSQNNRVLNNTIVMPSDGRWAINIPDTNDTGNQVFNNIMYSYHTWRGCILIPAPGLAGFQSDYNVVLDRFSTDGGDTRIGLAEWQALGYDTHSLVATPGQLFVDPAGGDYHLKAGSPAIDNGTALPDVPDDLEGNARPVGPAFDIGAYERQVPLPATVTDLRVTHATVSTGTLTVTLCWAAPAPVDAVTTTLRHANTFITEANWPGATLLTDALPGSAGAFTATVPYVGGTAYFALKSQNADGAWSGLSNNAFWPHWDVFLPLVTRDG